MSNLDKPKQPKIIDIDHCGVENVIEIAVSDADNFIKSTTLSSHRCVNPSTAVTWVNYNKPYPFISFTVNSNPFSIFLGKNESSSATLEQLKSIDYSFPITCVSHEIVQYMETFINRLNEKFNFNNIKYEKDIQQDQKLNKFRKFFNFPKGSKNESATDIGSVRIDVPSSKNKDQTKYELIINDENKNKIIEPKKIQDLLTSLPKFETYRLYIKPCRIVSSSIYFGEEFKLMWQVFKIDIISSCGNDLDYLKSLPKVKQSSSNENVSLSNQLGDQNEESNIKN